MFGVVTDYSIFFLSHFRRHLREGLATKDAAQRSASEVAGIVLVAGLIVALSTGALVFAELPFLLGGDTAISANFIDRTMQDLVRVGPVALLAAVLVLALYLRSLVAPLFLAAASVLALLAALGISATLSGSLLDPVAVAFFVPFAVSIAAVGARLGLQRLSRRPDLGRSGPAPAPGGRTYGLHPCRPIHRDSRGGAGRLLRAARAGTAEHLPGDRDRDGDRAAAGCFPRPAASCAGTSGLDR